MYRAFLLLATRNFFRYCRPQIVNRNARFISLSFPRCFSNTTDDNPLTSDKCDDTGLKLEDLSKEILELRNIVNSLNNDIRIEKNLKRDALEDVTRIRIRANKEIEEAKSFGCSVLAKDLIEVADVLDRAITYIPADIVLEAKKLKDDVYAHEFDKLYEGLVMTQHILNKTFHKHGVDKIVPELGSQFDPSLHHAKFEIPYENGGYEPKSIGEIFRVGYSINGRIIRPAEVGVIKY